MNSKTVCLDDSGDHSDINKLHSIWTHLMNKEITIDADLSVNYLNLSRKVHYYSFLCFVLVF